jgi:hypothetical protein
MGSEVTNYTVQELVDLGILAKPLDGGVFQGSCPIFSFYAAA